MTPGELTDEFLTEYAEERLAAGDLGGWNIANSGRSDSPIAKRTDLHAAIRQRLCDRVNGHAGTDSGADTSAVLAVALNAINTHGGVSK